MTQHAERKPIRVLLVDDEPAIRKTFRFCLEDAGYEVLSAATLDEAKVLLEQQVFQLCFLDLRLGNDSGLSLLPLLQANAPWVRTVIITAHSSVDSAVKAMRAGAHDYLVKPCGPEQLLHAAATQSEAAKLRSRVDELERDIGADHVVKSFGESPAMQRVIEQAKHVAGTDASVLVLGASGTGKNVLARAIHHWSPRAEHAFATVNCPSLSADLLERELFGHKRGAFTGAHESSLGRVNQADGGTLFLDEIGEFPLAMQPKLLRFIQDKEYERLGDPVTRTADVRIIAATNRDLSAMVKLGEFREDLLYRLNVITLTMPSLAERRDDIPVFANVFLREFHQRYQCPAEQFHDDALQALQDYRWPGNIRELRNVIERAAITCPQTAIAAHHLHLGEQTQENTLPRAGDNVSLAELEKAHILAVVNSSATVEAAAKQLGIDASTLYRKRKQFEQSGQVKN
ncbi:sigma-54-dependent transcriptional regulator [Permianibacter aggregans]|uniref:Two-component response regulator AlgB n=1 Tax=Permianibacter aggregans TaxID=1510150 RepID=A0A4R6UBZ8_9GAMM|nr:sigma-54 dependent transcriptional regulator [Permianibacter aggregans]QGX40707.1 sigma-54-dependent Fis family transcriptional regulator [Permianibacter aggregans]TDQ43406.1 two-component response regulator AlgB [Permianibacter aggregans]